MNTFWQSVKEGAIFQWDYLCYCASFGHFSVLEGRYNKLTKVYSNWNKLVKFAPKHYCTPSSLEEIITIIKSAKQIRVVGAGHSFNRVTATSDTLISLDRFKKVLSLNPHTKQVHVQAGIRLRELNAILYKNGLALTITGTFNAQSIAGLIATDVHGTGRDQGFISQSVLEVTIVDGLGNVRKCKRGEDLFKATVGGVGLTGIILEAVFQCESIFYLEKVSTVVERKNLFDNLDQLLKNNEHVKLLISLEPPLGRIDTWNRVKKPKFNVFYFYLFTLFDMEYFIINQLFKHWKGALRFFSSLHPKKTKFTAPSHFAFLYPRNAQHQEMEWAIPYDQLKPYVEEIERTYHHGVYPTNLIEIRFTKGHHNSLIGAGGNIANCAWVDELCSSAGNYKAFFKKDLNSSMKYNGLPHWGKYLEGTDPEYLEKKYGENLKLFKNLIANCDPERKFVSDECAKYLKIN